MAWHFLVFQYVSCWVLFLIKLSLLIKRIIFQMMKTENSLTKYECICESMVCWESSEAGKEATFECIADYDCSVVFPPPTVLVLNDCIKSHEFLAILNFCCYVTFAFVSKLLVVHCIIPKLPQFETHIISSSLEKYFCRGYECWQKKKIRERPHYWMISKAKLESW